MAVMSDTDRARTMFQIGRDNQDPIGITKADLRAAVNATDDWINSNQASYNTALPEPAKSSLSAAQKTLVFVYVAMRRQGLLPTQDD